jgi:hypothetical protein
MKNTYILILLLLPSIISFSQNKPTVFDGAVFLTESAHLVKSGASEISPVFMEDSIYFSGVDQKHFKNGKRDKKNPGFYNMYSVAIDKEGNMNSSRTSVPELSNDYNEGPAAYCKATGELFITLNNMTDFDKVQKMVPVENINLQLAIMKKVDGRWQIVEKLPFNDNRYHFAQPAISVSGDTLIFTSDLDVVNYGKTDLFMSIRKNGKWSSPVNLGNKVNTPGNELFPTFIPGNILSFSSNGHEINNGGLDIYYSDFPVLNKVQTLGTVINSTYDDFGLIIHENLKIGYFTSNRNSKSSDDIFRLEILKR